MALKNQIGGIKVSDVQLTTVLPVEKLLEMTIGGLAFEQDATSSAEFDHLDARVRQLRPARSTVQRTFFNTILKDKRERDPKTGEWQTVKVPGFGPSAKLRNARGDLLKYVKESFIDAPDRVTAALPAFILYFPEKLEAEGLDSFNAAMGGEFHLYDLTGVGKAMIADGESRHLAIETALRSSGAGALSGSKKEKLKNKLLTVEIYHGIEPLAMGQIFADVNGKGVGINKNEAAARDTRDKWTLATKQIFEELGVPVEARGRQVSRASQAEGKHLLLSQARTMVRGIGLGSHTKVVSSSDLVDGIDFDKVVRAGVQWFRIVLDHFDGPAVFTDPERVVRTMPVKVAIGIMGHAWYTHDKVLQHQHRKSLSTIQWRVNKTWNGVAGKVTGDEASGFKLAASGAKEVGSRAYRALNNPTSKDGMAVRP